MKDQVKRFIIRHPALELLMYNFYRIKGGNKAISESERRKELSLFDYNELIKDIPFVPQERVIDNNLYGYAFHVKKYAGFDGDLKGYMEHGLYWGVHKDARSWHFNKFYTLSSRKNEEIIRELSGKTVISLGPYIHYAKPLFKKEDRNNLKKELGKTLLVFPSHSVKNMDVSFDLERFISEINRRKKGFKSVLVCMYFIDAWKQSLVERYEKEGYRIVTSGHRLDNYFVARQRTLIELADMTMSNEVGTHLGFCIYLNKPHFLFSQSLRKKAVSNLHQKRYDNEVQQHIKKEISNDRAKLSALFSSFRNEISEEQYAICNRLWGFDEIKSKKELQDILTN
jgi:hypothetical protein